MKNNWMNETGQVTKTWVPGVDRWGAGASWDFTLEKRKARKREWKGVKARKQKLGARRNVKGKNLNAPECVRG